MHEIDDELFYAVEEKTHVIDLTEKGREHLSSSSSDKDMFVLPDIGTEVAAIEGDKFLDSGTSPEEERGTLQIIR